MELDASDRALLAALQDDARLPQAALGARVGLSAAAVNRRIARLTFSGHISGTSAVLDPEVLGYPTTVIAHLALVDERTDRLDALETALTANPHVQQCYYVTGEWDFVVIMLVRDMAQYRELTRELFFAGGNVKRFESSVVMHQAKKSLDVPLGP